MARPKLLTDLLIEQVALLISEGMSQAKIKKILGVSQSTVSRALKEARGRKLLERRLVCKLSSERRREVRELIYAHGLTGRLQALQPDERQYLREVHIVDIGKRSDPADEESYAERLEAFGKAASGYFARSILPKVRKLGVAWGATLRHLVDNTRDGGDRPDEPEHIDLLPVCGTAPEAHRDNLRSASTLVAQLDEFWNGRSDNPHNFSGVAASISHDFDDAEAEVLRRFFLTISGYRKVFGDGREAGEIDKVDCILTSVGSNRVDEAPWLVAAAEAAGVRADVLAGLTLGNVAGVFLPGPGLGPADKTTVDELNGRWTGIRLEHFHACARAAAKGEGVGVVIAASGNKTDVLLECVRLGLVSVLLIDQHLAAELAARLEKRAA